MLPDRQVSIHIDFGFKLANLFAILVGIEVLFLLIDMIVTCCGLVTHPKLRLLLDITYEANIPTWFSSTQALVTGIVALLVGQIRSKQSERKLAKGWYLTGGFFIYLGIDDAAQIHERVSTFINDAVKDSGGNAFISAIMDLLPSYHWQLFFLPVFILVGVFMTWFLYHEFKHKSALPVFFAAMSCYAVAVGLDYIDGIPGNYRVAQEYLSFSTKEMVHLSRAIEEFLEMLGTTLFMMSFLLVYESPVSEKGEP